MTLDELRSALSDRTLTKVAERTGVSYGVLTRFMADESEPSYDAILTLIAYVKAQASVILNTGE